MVIFLDTYALIEIDLGNPHFKKYTLTPTHAITTQLNLIELYFVYLKRFGEKEANRAYLQAKLLLVPVDDSIIKEAMKFKLYHLKKRYSFADCIGYVMAKKLGAPFLTGDYAFKGLEGVEFVQ